jgi:putative transposase
VYPDDSPGQFDLSQGSAALRLKKGGGDMLLSEEHRIKACSSRSLFRQIDSYCYCAKNLSNSVNYMIRQIFRIHTKLKEGKVPEEWEAELMEQVNCGIRDYNEGRAKDRTLRHIDETNGFVADAYFLSWYLKKTAEYKAMPYATCSQICIQEKCREWKAFYRAKAAYAKDASSFAGRPCPTGYLDP